MADSANPVSESKEPAAGGPSLRNIDAYASDGERERLLERLEVAQAAAGIGIHDYDILNDRIEWDARVREMWGVGVDEPIHYATFASGVHPDDLAAVERAVDGATDPAGAGRYFARYRVRSRDGSERHVEATGQTIFRKGQAVRLVGTVRDVTSEVAAAAELERARAFADNLIQSAPTLLYIYDLLERRNRFIGPQIGPMTGMSSADYAGMGDGLLPTVIHPDDLRRVEDHHRAIREGRIQPPFEIEYRLRRADGSWVWLSSTEVVHARDEQGKPSQILGASLDITRRHEAEEMRELLIGEMAHRMKNVLSIIQSIAVRTLREGCAPEVWSGFERRIAALIAAQRLLTNENWRSAELKDVAHAVLRPFNDQQEARISLEGPSIRIEGGQVTTVALALHELATNAVKHGALSAPEGRVNVAWRLDGDGKTLEWRERGGPPVTAPTRSGFGSTLINALGRSTGGSKLSFEPEGLVCRLTL